MPRLYADPLPKDAVPEIPISRAPTDELPSYVDPRDTSQPAAEASASPFTDYSIAPPVAEATEKTADNEKSDRTQLSRYDKLTLWIGNIVMGASYGASVSVITTLAAKKLLHVDKPINFTNQALMGSLVGMFGGSFLGAEKVRELSKKHQSEKTDTQLH